MNPRALQGLGFGFAALPGLEALYGETPEKEAALARCARRFNCHPFLAPLALGIYLHTEEALVRGTVRAATVETMRETAFNTLSALGDTFFGGAITVTWVLLAAILLVCGCFGAAAGVTALLFVCLQIMKGAAFVLGVRHGTGVFGHIRRLDPGGLAAGLRYANAALVALFVLCVLLVGGVAPLSLPPGESAGAGPLAQAALGAEWRYGVVSLALLALALAVARLARGRGGAALRIFLCFGPGAGFFLALFRPDLFW